MKKLITMAALLVVTSLATASPYPSDAVASNGALNQPPKLEVTDLQLVAWPDTTADGPGEYRVVYTIRNSGGPTTGKFYAYAGVENIGSEHGEVNHLGAREVYEFSTRPMFFSADSYLLIATADVDGQFGDPVKTQREVVIQPEPELIYDPGKGLTVAGSSVSRFWITIEAEDGSRYFSPGLEKGEWWSMKLASTGRVFYKYLTVDGEFEPTTDGKGLIGPLHLWDMYPFNFSLGIPGNIFQKDVTAELSVSLEAKQEQEVSVFVKFPKGSIWACPTDKLLSGDGGHYRMTIQLAQTGQYCLGVSSNSREYELYSWEVGLTLVSYNSGIPTDFALYQNYPNPFNPSTSVEYALPQANEVVVSIFNTNGQLVETIQAGYQDAGYHNVSWNASNVSAGIYFLQFKAGNFSKTIKITLTK